MRARRFWWAILAGAVWGACDTAKPSTGAGVDGNQTDVQDSQAAAETTPDSAPDAIGANPDTPAAAETTVEVPTTPSCPEPSGERRSRRSEHAGIYDPIGRQLVFHGGSFAVPIQCDFPKPTFEKDVWAYDTTCQQWREVKAGEGPGGRGRHMAAYDSGARRMILFGGRYRAGTTGPYQLFDDLWALDLANESWAPVEPATEVKPKPRVNGALAYDPTRNQLVLFGGSLATGGPYLPAADLWIFDFATSTWEELIVPPGPVPRVFPSAFWDAGRQWLVIHGGADETAFAQDAKYFDDLWVLDTSLDSPTWRKLGELSWIIPDGRFWDGMVQDTVADRYLLFGGHDAFDLGNRNDVEAFDPKTESWTTLRVGDTWSKPPNGVCDFPPDFSNVDMTSPERRNAMVLVGDGASAWVFGGKTDCGAIDDTFRLDLATGEWVEEVTATVGESCLRKGGQTCNDLCF
jgi:hypothetical protein